MDNYTVSVSTHVLVGACQRPWGGPWRGEGQAVGLRVQAQGHGSDDQSWDPTLISTTGTQNVPSRWIQIRQGRWASVGRWSWAQSMGRPLSVRWARAQWQWRAASTVGFGCVPVCRGGVGIISSASPWSPLKWQALNVMLGEHRKCLAIKSPDSQRRRHVHMQRSQTIPSNV